MIASWQIKSLSEDEADLLCVAVNTGNPIQLYEYDECHIKSLPYPFYSTKVRAIKNQLNEEGLAVYSGVCQKLGINPD